MQKFFVQVPAGYEIEVQAENQDEAINIARQDWQSYPKIIYRSGSDRVFERSNGQRYLLGDGYSATDPEKIAQVMGGATSGEASTKGWNESIIAQFPALARVNEFVRGNIGGTYSDEMLGAVVGPEAMQASRAVSGAMQAERPAETLGLNLLGAANSAAMTMAAAPYVLPAKIQGGMTALGNAITSGPRYAQIAKGLGSGAVAGGIGGFISGVGEGTTPEDRLAQGAEGAKFGAAAGGVLGAATPIVAEAAKNVMSLFRRSDIDQIARELNISRDAARVIKNTFDQGGDMTAAFDRLNRAGESGMLADAGQAAQALLDASIASGGPAGQLGRQAIEARAADTLGRLEGAMDQTLGQPAAGPRTAVEEIQNRTSTQRKAAYDRALNQPVRYDTPEGMAIERVINRISPDVVQRAVARANEVIRAEELPVRQIMAQIGDDGTVTFSEQLNAYQLDSIKRSLQELAEAAKGPLGQTTGQSRTYSQLASDLRDRMVAGIEGYGDALKLGGDTIAERNAFMLGEDMTSPRVRIEDVSRAQISSDAQQEAFRRGLRTQIERVIGDVKRIPSDPNIDARQALSVLSQFASDNARAKLREALGPEADDLIRQIDEAMIGMETRAAVSLNSATNRRGNVQETVRNITEPNAAGQLAMGEPINTTKALIQAVTGQTSEYSVARRQQIYTDIVRALTEKGGDDAVLALRVIDQAMQGQPLTDAQTEQLARLIAGVLFSTGTTGTVPTGIAEQAQ